MKNLKKIIIIIVIGIIICVLSVTGIVKYFHSNHLTVSEKNWLDESKTTNKVININVVNNVNVFGDNGSGVYYDFIDDFASEYDLNINKVTYNAGEAVSGTTLGLTNTENDSAITLYTDHYVLVSPTSEIVNSTEDLSGKKIAILASDLSYVSNYIDTAKVTFVTYDKYEDIETALKESSTSAILPLHMYMDKILTNNYAINYHFSDINIYYTLTVSNDQFGSVLKKYYNNWQENFTETYNENLFAEVASDLGITDTEIDSIRSVTYKYAFLNNSPYEVISSGNYGGIAAVYLKNFMDFSGVDFSFTKYRNMRKFIKALNKDNIDVFFGYYNVDSSFTKTTNGINGKYYVIANSKNNMAVNSLASLSGKSVYVNDNSMLKTYLENLNIGLDIKTYDTYKDLLKLNKKDEIIIIDSNIYEYYKNHGLDRYTVRLAGDLNYTYGFNVKTNTALYKLLNAFVEISDPNTISNEGIYNHEQTIASGRVLSFIAKNFIYIVFIGLVVIYLVIRRTKKVTIAKKIKKDDKIRFIDQLTLLKNRNYLNENIKEWSKNTIYPQTVVIIDLNRLHEINDVEGYEEGDKQIKAAANVLIKTQLDNTDIIRTDGNEFVIYLVGYSQKQITNYIHKLNREFKKLPYNYGAEFGYSMILDDIKTIEDALNDATNSLKEQKELNESKD